jgi:hypothetical protein
MRILKLALYILFVFFVYLVAIHGISNVISSVTEWWQNSSIGEYIQDIIWDVKKLFQKNH